LSEPNAHRLDHQALLYRDLQELADVGGALIREGLEAEQPIWMITDGVTTETLRDALGADARHVEFHAASDWYTTGPRTLANTSQRLADAGPDVRVRTIGEVPVRGSGPTAVREWARYEALLNHVFAPARADLLCLYDASNSAPEVLEHARRTHVTLHEHGLSAPSAAYATPAAVLGELDAGPLPPAPADAAVLRFDDRPAPARAFATERAAAAGLYGQYLEDLRVAASEIITNAIVHGSAPRWLRTWIAEGHVVCEISDGGQGFASPFTGFAAPSLDAIGGRGVWIARQLCDLVEVRGAQVRLHMRLREG
jgi:anti-sigma regulatory factor (Ser/Thr protein kinase)